MLVSDYNDDSYAIEYKPKRRHIIQNGLSFKLNPGVDGNDVLETFNPDGDGFCGFRATAYLVYGDQDRYLDVKRKMLKAYEKNEKIYKNVYKFEMKRFKTTLVEGSESKVKLARHWFFLPECCQVIADAYRVPVCSYSVDLIDYTMTHLPIATPENPKSKHITYNIQHIGGNHWGPFKLKPLHAELPRVIGFYFDISPNKNNDFKLYWNKWKKFKKRLPPTGTSNIDYPIDLTE